MRERATKGIGRTPVVHVQEWPYPISDLTQARLLRAARDSSGLLRPTVALAMGWPVQHLEDLERGVVQAGLEELLALSHLYAMAGLDLVAELERAGGRRIGISRGSTDGN